MLLLSSRQGLGIILSGWCWGINQPQALLNKQLQGYSSSHSVISCSGGSCLQWSQESCRLPAVGDAFHCLVLVSWHLLCCADCYIPAVSNLAATLLK